MPYEEEPGAYWLLDLVHRRTPYDRRRADGDARGGGRRVHGTWALISCWSAASGSRTGSTAAFFVEGPSERKGVFAEGATLYAAGEPATVVVSTPRLRRHGP